FQHQGCEEEGVRRAFPGGCQFLSTSWPGKSAKRVFALDDPAIRVFLRKTGSKTWITGTSPVMTPNL
ncbi:MAG TPA: hypothetical protein VK526_06830, partial [Bradyrhizobium sp.]|nr:hypothetical protein [Bradyrhizobium sp.]